MPAKYSEVTGRHSTPEQWVAFATAMRQHGNISEAARIAGISRSNAARAIRYEEKYPLYRRAKDIAKQVIPDPARPLTDLSQPAQQALTDFGFFRQRYFGRVSTPWAVYSAEVVADKLATQDKEFILVNEPPGVGKSTFWTLDLPAWLICRDRGIRGQIGSSAQTTAQNYIQQLRREFEREVPIKASDEDARKGLAYDAEATLIGDFGGFKPARGEPWTTEQFVVKQVGDVAKGTREPTMRALGRDTKFLGWRGNFLVWDDLVDERGVKTAEAREDLHRWWFQYGETRLEPAGVCVLQGQRLRAGDLYEVAADVTVTEFNDDDTSEGWGEPVGTRKQYHHIKFKAHYAEHCRKDHNPKTAAPYDPHTPEAGGCLLDPKRLTYRDLMVVKDKDPRLYAVSYQQEDMDPASVLVNPIWVSGGTDPTTGETFPGCWDSDRGMGVIPQGLTRPWLSVVTADPSPTKFWAIQWWLFHMPTEQRFLINHTRQAMGANDFLDRIVASNLYDGLLEDWHRQSVAQGAPISHVIVEQNAAQRFLLQYSFVQDWSRLRKVTIIPHDTYANKTSKDYGVQALLPQVYRYGNVRLPGGDPTSRGRSMALVNEVTRYPESNTDDCVMAQWFAEITYPKLRGTVDRPDQPPKMLHRMMNTADYHRILTPPPGYRR